MANNFGGQFYPNGIDRERAESKDTLWLQVIPRALNLENIRSRVDAFNGNELKGESPMWFLMPTEWSYNIDHTWEDLSSISGAFKEIKAKVGSQYNSLLGEGGVSITDGHKADNPILYTNSTRRAFKVQLDFVVYQDTYNDVYVPVQKLVEYSCPEIMTGSTQFSYPYVFRLQTYTGDGNSVDIISVKTVAIQSVAPTYYGPWIDGYPSKATVDINFIDANPLYRSTLSAEKNKKMTTSTRKSTTTSRG